jgi:uncharacterized membrane protein
MSEFLKKHGYSILLGMVIFLGVLLRLKGLLLNPSMCHDECALAWNVKFKSYGDFFGILRFLQMAPPFFMVMTKVLTKIFGFSDISLRILPFLAGAASLFAFYFLAKKTLKNKFVILWAFFFFAINQRLINYSFEFKPYGFDVLFTIICLLFFINLDLKNLSIKKSVLYGALLSIVPWFSFVSVFVIAGGSINIFFKLIKTKSKKQNFPFSIFHFPLLISILIYAKIYLLNNYTGTHMVNYWQDSFLNANPIFFFSLLIENIRYLFFPMPFVLFPLILLLWGIGIYYREKSLFIEISATSFILLVIASLMNIYPFANRLILFLLPIFLLLIIKPLDTASFDRKIRLFIILLLTFFTFYPQIIEVNRFVHTKNVARGECPREMMDFMIKKIKPADNIFVNSTSDTEFAYYSSFYNLKNNIIQERVSKEPKEKYLAFLNALNKGYYWFYLPFDAPRVPVFQYILPWAKTQKILYSYQNNRSILMYVYVE